MADFVVPQRLFASDVRMLSCRRPSSTEPCDLVEVRAAGAVYLLCRRRVEVFTSPHGDGISLSGIQCF